MKRKGIKFLCIQFHSLKDLVSRNLNLLVDLMQKKVIQCLGLQNNFLKDINGENIN